MVLEAVGKGVVETPLSANVRHYHGGVEWFTCVDEISESDRHRMIEFAQQELGKEYARWKAMKFGFRILFQKDKKQRDELRRSRRLFCSHYVAQVYNAVGKDLKKGVSDRFMSPGDVAGSPLLKRAGALRKRYMLPGLTPLALIERGFFARTPPTAASCVRSSVKITSHLLCLVAGREGPRRLPRHNVARRDPDQRLSIVQPLGPQLYAGAFRCESDSNRYRMPPTELFRKG
jgi:hypothetical protein